MKRLLALLFILGISVSLRAQGNPDEALAGQYFQSGEFDKAAIIYERLLNRTKNAAYYDPYFASLLKTKQYGPAEELAKRFAKANPDNYTYAVDIGRVLQERGEQDKAAQWFDRLIREIPANEFAIKDLAITLYRAEAYDYSIKAFLNGRKVLNDEAAFSFDLLSLYRYRKDKPMLVQEYLTVLTANPGILPQAQNVLAGIFEDKADYDLLRTALLRRLQKDPQNLALTEFLTWQYIQQKDFDMAVRQTLALDRRLKEDGDRVFELSRLLMANQAYDQSIEALNYLVSKGETGKFYVPARIDLLNVKTRQLTTNKFSREELLSLEGDYQSLLKTFGRSNTTIFAIRQLANLQAFYLHKEEEAADQLAEVLELPGISPFILAQVKLELGDIYILGGEIWEAALLFGQVEKQFPSESYGQEAKFRNARLAYYRGDFVWAKAQLDVLKSSTSQLIANDALNLSLLISDNLMNPNDTAALKKYAEADLLIFKNQPDQALAHLDSIGILYPGNSLADDILMARSRVFLKNGDTGQAIKELQAVIEKYPGELWADDAIFTLAEIYETRLSQPGKALELYQKIITDFPGSLYVVEARKRFRVLRGDRLGTS